MNEFDIISTGPKTPQHRSAAVNTSKVKQTQPAESDQQRLNKACSAFESLFIHYMLKEMRATVNKSGLMDGGQGEEIYTSMLDARLAENLAERGGIGLASILMRQFESRTGQIHNPEQTAPAAESHKPETTWPKSD